MDFSCPHCNQRFHNDTPCAGRIINCPICHKNFEILNPDGSRAKKKCPYCGEEILAVAQKCMYCNEFLNSDLRRRNDSKVTYFLLGFFFGGLGVHNFYRGKAERNIGFAHLSLTIISIIFIVGWGAGGLPAYGVTAFNAV